jgi:hypothetical protein
LFCGLLPLGLPWLFTSVLPPEEAFLPWLDVLLVSPLLLLCEAFESCAGIGITNVYCYAENFMPLADHFLKQT